jgi:hypothetical protein
MRTRFFFPPANFRMQRDIRYYLRKRKQSQISGPIESDSEASSSESESDYEGNNNRRKKIPPKEQTKQTLTFELPENLFVSSGYKVMDRSPTVEKIEDEEKEG